MDVGTGSVSLDLSTVSSVLVRPTVPLSEPPDATSTVVEPTGSGRVGVVSQRRPLVDTPPLDSHVRSSTRLMSLVSAVP